MTSEVFGAFPAGRAKTAFSACRKRDLNSLLKTCNYYSINPRIRQCFCANFAPQNLGNAALSQWKAPRFRGISSKAHAAFLPRKNDAAGPSSRYAQAKRRGLSNSDRPLSDIFRPAIRGSARPIAETACFTGICFAVPARQVAGLPFRYRQASRVCRFGVSGIDVYVHQLAAVSVEQREIKYCTNIRPHLFLRKGIV